MRKVCNHTNDRMNRPVRWELLAVDLEGIDGERSEASRRWRRRRRLFVGRRGKCDPVTSRSLLATLARVLHTLPSPGFTLWWLWKRVVYPLPLAKLNSINVPIIREDQVYSSDFPLVWIRVVCAPVGGSSARLATQGSLTCICMHYSDIPDVSLTVHANRSEVRRQCWPDAKA